MALVRILIDGYSLLHRWPEVAEGKARHSASAREELLAILQQYGDATSTPITIFFDGAGAPPGTPKQPSSRNLEILYSRAAQTADDMIERTAHRMKPYGEVLVVTDDIAERDIITGQGHLSCSCDNFIRDIGAALNDFSRDLDGYNQRERARYKDRR